MWRITNDLVTQVRDLAGKVTHLEEEKEKYVADTEKLVRATSMSQLEHIKTLQASIEACNVLYMLQTEFCKRETKKTVC